MKGSIGRCLAALALLLPSLLLWGGAAQADWVLDPAASRIGFASVKNGVVAENHHFTDISGSLTDAGDLRIVIMLASVETLIPIRNERMQTLLFKTADFPQAVIAGKGYEVQEFLQLAPGASRTAQMKVAIALHGESVEAWVAVKVVRSAMDQFEVASLGPVMLNAAAFNLEAGVEALRAVVGLDSISLMVPVTFALTFKAAPGS